MAKKLSGLRLAAELPENEPVASPAALNPDVFEFARRHRSEIMTSEEEVPTQLRDLKPVTGTIDAINFYVPDLLSGSDFSDSVHVSNYRRFMRDYSEAPGVYPVVGSHNSFAVAIRLSDIDSKMLDVFVGLEDYIAIDDEDVSQVEYEATEEAWHDWAMSDFSRSLVQKFPDFEEQVDGMGEEQLRPLFEKLRERVNAEWTHDGSTFIDVQPIANAAVPEDFGTKAAETVTASKKKADRVNPYPGWKEDFNKARDAEKAKKEEKPEEKQEKKAAGMDEFTKAYFEAALFASTDNANEQGGDPLDQNYDITDFAPETAQRMIADCEKFQAANGALITDENLVHQSRWDAQQHGGHDFWLTRNGHGAGFWDGDWKKEVGDALTKAAKAFGGFDLYIGDDGKIWA